REHDNLRAALDWTIGHGESEIALRLAGSLGIFWERRGYLTEGRRWLKQVLELPVTSSEHRVASTESGGNSLGTRYSLLATRYRAIALYSCGILALRQRDYTSAQSLLEQSRSLYKEQGDKEGLSNALSALAVMTVDRDFEQAVQLHMESL